MRKTLIVCFVALFLVGVTYEADARRFGGSFKFSSARSYKAPAYKSFSRKTQPKATSTQRANPSTARQRQGGFAGSNRSSAQGATSASRRATSSRFAQQPTNNFKSTRQQNAYRNYQSTQQNRFSGSAKASGTNAKSTPIYKNASRQSNNSRNNYWQRRDDFYGGWNTPSYVYMGGPRYGMFDGLFLGYMLGHAFTPHYSAMAYHHRHDPGMKAYLEDMEAQAADNAEIRAQLDALNAEVARLEGTPIDPNYLPPGVDPDLVLAPDVVRTLAPTFRLCTASMEGNYHRFGEAVSQQVGEGVILELVHTKGSMQNLQYVQEGRCDGAYVQRNAFVTYAERNPGGTYNFERISTPAVEFAHLICNRNSGVDAVGDLEGKLLLIDEIGSGTEVTWHDFVSMDSNYERVETDLKGGMNALNAVANGRADCMLFVASLNTTLLQRANTMGDQLVLVPVNDWDFNDKKYGHGKLFDGFSDPSGERVYVFLEIPDDQYDNIQDGLIFSEVETLTVPVDMVASLDWQKANAEAYEFLLSGVIDAQSEIASITQSH